MWKTINKTISHLKFKSVKCNIWTSSQNNRNRKQRNINHGDSKQRNLAFIETPFQETAETG